MGDRSSAVGRVFRRGPKTQSVRAIAIAGTLLASSLLPPQADAQAPETTAPDEDVRTVNGHTFVPLRTVEWPFITTSFGTITSFGVIDLISRRGRDAEVLGFRQAFSLHILATPWLGFEVEGAAFIAVGVNAPAALNDGAGLALGGTVGAVVRLFRSRYVYLSTRLQGQALRTEGIVPRRAVETEGDRVVGLGDPLITGRYLRLIGSLSLAIAPNRWLGIQLSVGVSGNRVDSEGQDDATPAFQSGLGLQVDFASFGVPIALVFGGRVVQAGQPDVQIVSVEPAGRTRGQLEFGIFYTGRRNLALGLSTLGERATADRRFRADISFRYFW